MPKNYGQKERIMVRALISYRVIETPDNKADEPDGKKPGRFPLKSLQTRKFLGPLVIRSGSNRGKMN